MQTTNSVIKQTIFNLIKLIFSPRSSCIFPLPSNFSQSSSLAFNVTAQRQSSTSPVQQVHTHTHARQLCSLHLIRTSFVTFPPSSPFYTFFMLSSIFIYSLWIEHLWSSPASLWVLAHLSYTCSLTSDSLCSFVPFSASCLLHISRHWIYRRVCVCVYF